ncbi:hypothetical protein KC363_g2433 [Hortaea werneckii]|nr:hypothetical protein KC361_g4746 [Hortaea werneckii]KAI6884565.1 hypothetical protein KC325_g4191 [Hortaea werneckii]KAI6996406.1 hypothetical protein KC359_g3513 [Hortaea werneckii]KAI7090809.1 hypothetical protein KC356_g1135 [Hortaea werneckii]KAI7147840.1 hypothetical protein KC344_g2472 [Hortaea werneckii]
MHFNFLALLAFAGASLAAPAPALEERQLLNSLLCPLTGSPTCALQCQLLKQMDGVCSPQNICFCNDGSQIAL